LTLTRCTII